MSPLQQQILNLADGKLFAREIAAIVGCHPKHVQNVCRRHGAPQTTPGARLGAANTSWGGGRRIDRTGYVLVSVPRTHPHCRKLPKKNYGHMLEHRLVMEQQLGRYLEPPETVDHIDGLTLHNAPSNLRLFASNGKHLQTTLAGSMPVRSAAGLANIQRRYDRLPVRQRIDIYKRRLKRGDVRLQQILLAASQLGANSPYLLGTTRPLTKAGIFDLAPTTIERALADLSDRFAADLLL